MPLETFEGARENRIWEGWRWESHYKRNNVYNVPFRWNSKFVSLSTIIFRNLHTNRFRGPRAKWNKGDANSFVSPLYCFLHFHPHVCIEKRYDSTRHPRSLSHHSWLGDSKILSLPFSGVKYCSKCLGKCSENDFAISHFFSCHRADV